MKCINLNSLNEAFSSFTRDELEQYLNVFGIKVSESEFEDLGVLVNELKVYGLQNFNNFYIGFTINQISKEFDLLRFSENEIINIELKRTSTTEKIHKQLTRNKYYLEVLGKEIYNYTFTVENNQLYKLEKDGNLNTVSIKDLITTLNSQTLIDIPNIHDLFVPSKYLVSPFNSTTAFINDAYFLTEHQENIKNDIITSFKNTNAVMNSIVGNPGTGKTLLTYDLVKHFLSLNKKTLIVHCGKLNFGHERLRDFYNWDIIPVKDYKHISKNYEVIILDEAQRIYTNQLEVIVEDILRLNAKAIFSYDPRQCFNATEINRKVPDYLENTLGNKTYRLTDKIRSNKEIASFILSLNNLSRRETTNQNYTNIHVQYFDNATTAKAYAQNLSIQGWKVINYTKSQFNSVSYDSYQNYGNPNAHDVIGQEFDKVVTFIDNHFYYNQEQKLVARSVTGAPNYDLDKMLYQILTRARQEITIVIINNKLMLNRVLEILGHNIKTIQQPANN